MRRLSKISKQEFIKRLKKKKFEDIDAIKLIERNFLKKRGYIFKMPKPRTPVVMLFSGGLDSTVCWNILLKDYRLKVFPLTINRGRKQRKKEKTSVNYFSEYYKKRYPDLYKEPIYLDVVFKAFNIPIEDPRSIIHPKTLLETTNDQGEITTNLSLGSFTIYPVIGKLYAEYLYQTKNLNIDTIFCSITAGDGEVIPEQTFTTLRAGMWYLCQSTANFKWQFSSVALEKETGMYLSKADLVRWGSKDNLPLEKTWSCHRGKLFQCGNECMTCIDRRKSFKKAGVTDKTIYFSNIKNNPLKYFFSFNKQTTDKS